MSNAFNQIASAMAQQARHEIHLAREADRARPIGERAVDIRWYDRSDERRSLPQKRWAACLVKWTGERWQRVRKLTGPLTYEKALTATTEHAKRLGLNRV